MCVFHYFYVFHVYLTTSHFFPWCTTGKHFDKQTDHNITFFGPIPTRSFLKCLSHEFAGHFWLFFFSQRRNLIITIASTHIVFDWRRLIITRHFCWKRKNNNIYMRCESSCHDWCFNCVRERPAPAEARRRNLWCLFGPAEKLSRLYRPSARGSTYDWQNCRSFLSI